MPYLDNVSSELVPRNVFTPNKTQITTLIVASVYIFVIAILWCVFNFVQSWALTGYLRRHVPYLKYIIYPFKLLTVGFHEMSHAFVGVLTCAKIKSIELDPNEGGATMMQGGISWLTLPAGYLGSSFIGACLITCGFDTNASKVASIVLAAFFLITLWWARRDWLTWVVILGTTGLILIFWFVAGGVALRYLVLFIGVMSCMYAVWDTVDDTVLRKVNESDASQFARICGCFPSQVWGVIWFFVAVIFFALGVLVGLAVFKESEQQQKSDASHFLPVPGSSSGALSLVPTNSLVLSSTLALLFTATGLL